MDSEEIIQEAERLRTRVGNSKSGPAAKAQVCEFFRNYAAPKSSFLKEAEAVHGVTVHMVASLHSIVGSFVEYVEAGLATGMSPERQAQLDVVSDLLGQADSLLEDTKFIRLPPQY